jgi:hypothetical protein
MVFDLGTSEKTVKVHRARELEEADLVSCSAIVRLVDLLGETEGAQWSVFEVGIPATESRYPWGDVR